VQELSAVAADCKALAAKSKLVLVEEEEKRTEEAEAEAEGVAGAGRNLVDRSPLGVEQVVEQVVDFQVRIDCLVGEARQFGTGSTAGRVPGVEVGVDRSLEDSLRVDPRRNQRRAESLGDTVPELRD